MSENTKWYADCDYWMTNRGFIWPEKRLSNSARDVLKCRKQTGCLPQQNKGIDH